MDRIRPVWVLLLFSILALFPFINRETAYTVPGEYRWTLPTAVETYNSDNRFLPVLFGEARLRKPPLGYWLMSLSGSVLGLSLFSMRLPSVFFGISSVIGCLLLAKALALKGSAAACGLILLATSGFYTFARVAALEIHMLFFTLAAFWGLAVYLLRENTRGLYAAALFTGLTLLVKSHATAVSVVFFIVMWQIFFRAGRKSVRLRDAAIALLIVIFVAAPWYVFAFFNFREAFLSNMAAEIVSERFFTGTYRIDSLITGMFSLLYPYTLIFIFAVYAAVKRRSASDIFLLLLMVSVIFPYLFVSSHRMRYMVPALPAAAVLVASTEAFRRKIPMRITAVLLLITGLAALAAGSRINIFIWPHILAGSAAVFLVFYCFWKASFSALIAAPLYMLVFMGYLYSSAGLWSVPEDIVAHLEQEEFATFNRRPFFLPVKLRRPPAADITDLSSLRKAADAEALVYVTPRNIRRLEGYLNDAGLEGYEKVHTWTRFNEFPKNSDVRKAFIDGKREYLEEDTYFIRIY